MGKFLQKLYYKIWISHSNGPKFRLLFSGDNNFLVISIKVWSGIREVRVGKTTDIHKHTGYVYFRLKSTPQHEQSDKKERMRFDLPFSLDLNWLWFLKVPSSWVCTCYLVPQEQQKSIMLKREKTLDGITKSRNHRWTDRLGIWNSILDVGKYLLELQKEVSHESGSSGPL